METLAQSEVLDLHKDNLELEAQELFLQKSLKELAPVLILK